MYVRTCPLRMPRRSTVCGTAHRSHNNRQSLTVIGCYLGDCTPVSRPGPELLSERVLTIEPEQPTRSGVAGLK